MYRYASSKRMIFKNSLCSLFTFQIFSCEKCKKLRNGIKFSMIVELPEILTIHLKRFRHEPMFSSKISSHIAFPIRGLDMKPWISRGKFLPCCKYYK